jgi:dihydroorotate dehydrogenase electron transfer subunit
MMTKRIHDMRVVRNQRLTPDYFELELHAPEPLPLIQPGQFVEALVEGATNTFLRRPFSIHDVDYAENTIKLLIEIVGEGTQTLAWLEEGDFLNIIYPLGNSFDLPAAASRVLIVGGGCGIAPLLYLARQLNEQGCIPDILLGTRSSDRLIKPDEYRQFGELHITTEDGTAGTKGYVVHHPVMKAENPAFDRVYTCGPEPMMRVVAKWAMRRNIDCRVSLENTMACGIGACLCCVTETTSGNVCVCTEGPVFNPLALIGWSK